MKKKVMNVGMKLKFLFSILAILFVFLLMCGTAFAANPIQISTFEQLMAIDDSVENLSKDYILMNDIDVQNSTLFKPIGSYSYTMITDEYTGNPFTGTFNGNGYTISNVTFSNNNTMTAGLFGGVERASISNLSLENISLTGQYDVGGLIGRANHTKIMNCSIVNSDICLISGKGRVGGLVGRLHNSNVSNSYAISNVEGKDSVGCFVGAIDNSIVSGSYATGNVDGENGVGSFAGTMWDSSSIFDSYATGNVIGSYIVGGFVGGMWDSSSIFDSYATSSAIIKSIGNETSDTIDTPIITLTNNETKSTIVNPADSAGIMPDIYVGGFAGYVHNNSSISRSYAIGNAEGTSYVGGFIGGMSESSMISESYATGNATGSNNVGGFVGGMNNSSISNSYAAGNAIGSNNIGGFAGGISDAAVSYCYSIGNSKAISDGNNIGGFAGYQKNSKIMSCFSPTKAGHDNGLSIVKPDADLKKKETFEATYSILPANPTDFSKPWNISSSSDSSSIWYVDENNDYPKLLWNSSSSLHVGLVEISILIIISLLIFVVIYCVFQKWDAK